MADPRIVYVTYADGAFEKNLKPNAFFARHFMRADQVLLFTRIDLESSEIYAGNRAVFDAPRGKGYWAWKPFVILEALKSSRPGDVVIYHDCGFGLRYKSFIRPKSLLNFALENGFIAGVRSPRYGPNRRWNHRRCLEIVGDFTPEYLEASTVEASISFWPSTPRSKAFVTEWLQHCLDPNAIRDILPEERRDQADDFVEHRYDQAILTNLAIKHAAPVVEPFADSLPFAKSISMLEIDMRAHHSAAYRMLLRGFHKLLALRNVLRRQGRRLTGDDGGRADEPIS